MAAKAAFEEAKNRRCATSGVGGSRGGSARGEDVDRSRVSCSDVPDRARRDHHGVAALSHGRTRRVNEVRWAQRSTCQQPSRARGESLPGCTSCPSHPTPHWSETWGHGQSTGPDRDAQEHMRGPVGRAAGVQCRGRKLRRAGSTCMTFKGWNTIRDFMTRTVCMVFQTQTHPRKEKPPQAVSSSENSLVRVPSARQKGSCCRQQERMQISRYEEDSF